MNFKYGCEGTLTPPVYNKEFPYMESAGIAKNHKIYHRS